MNRQISPELLKSFITIADEGSFQRAASRVGRTQSAVSMQIKRLEDLLGHQLFTRERPNVRLTPKGETLLSYARRFLELQDEVWQVLSEPKAEGTVRFGIPDDYANGLLPRILEGFAEGIKIYSEMLNATPAYAVITTAGNSRHDQIAAGRRWMRLNLTTTELGLALHPVSQALQEFPEMAEHYDRAHQLLGEPGHTVQMLGRLGFGPTVRRSPRWPLEKRIING